MWEKRGALTAMQGCSFLVRQCHNTELWTFLKLITMMEHIKMMQIPYPDIWPMLFSGEVPHRSHWSQLSWNLENPVLVQKLSYRREITYHRLLIAFFHKLISMEDVYITCSLTAAIALSSCTSYRLSLLPNIAWLTQVKNEGRETWHGLGSVSAGMSAEDI